MKVRSHNTVPDYATNDVNQELCQILLIYYITLAGLLCIFRIIKYVKIQMKVSVDRYGPLSV